MDMFGYQAIGGNYMKNTVLMIAMLMICTATRAQSIDTTQMIEQLNKMRAEGCKCGNIYMAAVPPLKWNETLEKAALEHSEYMAKIKVLKHQGADGSKAGDRITQNGYNWRTYGENVAMGPETITAVVELWKNSPSHCKNIMNPAFTEIGAAKTGKYWTQVFATPR